MLYKKFGKRMIDIILSLIGIILFFPLFLIIFILVKFDSKHYSFCYSNSFISGKKRATIHFSVLQIALLNEFLVQ